jgi:uroporphyrinogen-III synthase
VDDGAAKLSTDNNQPSGPDRGSTARATPDDSQRAAPERSQSPGTQTSFELEQRTPTESLAAPKSVADTREIASALRDRQVNAAFAGRASVGSPASIADVDQGSLVSRDLRSADGDSPRGRSADQASAKASAADLRQEQPAKHVVVTRAESEDGPLSTQLRELGLPVLLWPAVSVAVAETGALEEALESIADFDWIVFASRHAVAAVIERVETPPANVRVAAVGQATGQVLRQRGWPVDLLPEDANAAALVSEFATRPMQGTKVLFPASSRALPTIAAGLTQLGATVTQVEAYRTEPASLDVEACRSWIDRDGISAVTFASPSAVIELEHSLGKEHFDRLLKSAQVIAIGPTTARALEEHGCSPIMAESANLRGLAETTFRSLQTRD